MFIGRLRAVVPFIAMVVLTLNSGARAATVDYSTYGYFGGVLANTSKTVGAGNSAATLSFTGFLASVDAPTIAKLGTFFTTLGSNANFTDSFAGTTFTLQITQGPLPQPGLGTVSSSITGVLKKTSNLPGSTLFVDWAGATLTLPTFPSLPSAKYSPYNTPISAATSTTLEGLIEVNSAAVPLPPAVWGGLSLLGLMGVKGLRRKQLLNAGE